WMRIIGSGRFCARAFLIKKTVRSRIEQSAFFHRFYAYIDAFFASILMAWLIKTALTDAPSVGLG
ncbi:hypothetical protein, partial [Oceanisphaera sp. KMM 10153]|uniref:hypothetical protein n=1 Tax=Oceanisphaera submarina TaxID=3390193 RepID=UPI0039771518